MNKHRTHQIDEAAQAVLKSAIPPSWVLNDQGKDYAKDYLVEIGEDNNDLSGDSFYIQLKGQEKATFIDSGKHVSFSLKSRYAKYYLDKITDLPVYLVVVDIGTKHGWWLFMQPYLENDQRWRDKNSHSINIPVENTITDMPKWEGDIENAKAWLRAHHPSSIADAIGAQKNRFQSKDDRFKVKVTLVDEKPVYELRAIEEVPITFVFKKDSADMLERLSNLFDKGMKVEFLPGEVLVTGSRMFEEVADSGLIMQAQKKIPVSITLICEDDEGKELGRLGDIKGIIAGGQKEMWCEGSLGDSLFTMKLGPIGIGMSGTVTLNISLRAWNNQKLLNMAYFDQFHQFIPALMKSKKTRVVCQESGNEVFSVTAPLHEYMLSKGEEIARYLALLFQTRFVMIHYKRNPAWVVDEYDEDNRKTAAQMYALLNNKTWKQEMPFVRLKASRERHEPKMASTIRPNQRKTLSIESSCTVALLGEKIDEGRMLLIYTDMAIRMVKPRVKKEKGIRQKANNKSQTGIIKYEFTGSKTTLLYMRKMKDGEEINKDENELILDGFDITIIT